MRRSIKLVASLMILSQVIFGVVGTSAVTQSEFMGDNHVDEVEPLSADNATVPTVEMNTYWRYQHDIWSNDTDSGDWMHIEEKMNYTVSDIGYFDYNGTDYYCYNLSIDIDVTGGEGSMSGYSITINGGTGSGYVWKKVSDLGVVKDHQERYIDATAEGYIPVDIWMNQTRAYQPVVENYDFPIKLDERFWSNTTQISQTYYHYDAGSAGSGEEWSNDTTKVNQINEVYPSLVNINVPCGSFSTNHINSSFQGDGSDGNIKRWYNSSARSYVKENGDTTLGNSSYDWIKRLESYDVVPNANSQVITPDTERIGNNVTVSGQFPNHPNQQITIEIPEGAKPASEWQTTTDSGGYFSKEITVPLASDNTETLIDWSSNGFVASVDSAPQDAYVVSTLTILPKLKDMGLEAGWHFISFPLDPIREDISSILEHQNYGISGNYDKVIYYDGNESDWKSYVPGRSSRYNSFERIRKGRGFWIHMLANDTLTIEGIPVYDQNITLHPGWNMAGYAVSSVINAGSSLPTEVSKMGVFNSSMEYNVEYVTDLTSIDMNPREGYLIYNSASNDVVWRVP